MPPRWESPFDTSPRDAAMLADVLAALHAQLGSASPDATGDPDTDKAPVSDPDVQHLISAALAELQRLAPEHRAEGGVAPVLGSGVVHELLRQQREPRLLLAEEAEPTVDERF